ncbi:MULTISPECIES: bifunctional 5,10-methylenetetrahydrofolate dehydrogenase/5,10-methenyltetrahydrofolate cyclohydrolase [Kosmotoga]|jgi:methylenetetrahydrofolate dehydrogenase (NADP+)/methenyltetrahydrofolate cyclohydrolase|uniref:Bifunctional protein FolD n=1 Tax=Kosmotoga olearia (strain ATCC BAA-1733 / DSM 21960 / TBF 19.5.1) TaxID=521045 RepID=FOLD_KOSOT|nr:MULTISPECIES: bifunctional 5,10-methylenetetrahydrofolate dehydrogenase/5,10-methenyltetrahydrofolate cyclohydrolase [Kosmotoga]C5CI88.1 RecName: Full=Bifunctional protein FolD; Includes: RecName: Full=Methylenetetrahydrofolate dehydrogenase; Includes: RecName: Full=Methenyltetrahydrofolate cyclohydrolase [Kosmotoga olearia TBF 19.5.1]ACR80790.1 Methylenetetrahydrofolate dehydrogenase (NADP(+)) [Kosmotoga olearia TBF 19.5.1]MDI3523960.1 methylenetetrahydrofolate dehydrogenase / methenyltetrah
MGILLDGKPVAKMIYAEIKEWLGNLQEKPPKLVLFCSEPDDSTKTYMNSIVKRGGKLGISVEICHAGENPVEEIKKLNESRDVAGVMIMHPLKNVDEKLVVSALSLEKDVEGRTPGNLGGIMTGDESFAPPTAEAVMEILRFYDVSLSGKDVTIVGRSTTVGKPLSMLMLKKGIDATVTICHSRTKNLVEKIKRANVLVSAVGRAGFITKEMVGKDSIIIDVGINLYDGKIVGDVDFEQVEPEVAAITPVPGGVGIVTTAILFRHFMVSSRRMVGRR